jgi:hypothetical protein
MGFNMGNNREAYRIIRGGWNDLGRLISMEKSLSQMTVPTFAAAGRTFSNISYAQHPEDQIRNIVREKRSVPEILDHWEATKKGG